MAIQNAVEVDLQYELEASQGILNLAAAMTQQRRVSSSLGLTKATFQSQEARLDRNISDFRHGLRSVTGDLQGEVSLGAWDAFIEAAMGGTWDTELVLDETNLTSIAVSGVTWSTGGGTLIGLGLRIGDVINFGSTLSEAANNNVNFTITDIPSSGSFVTSPVATDFTADTTFTLTRAGRKVLIGGSSSPLRTFTIEQSYSLISQFEIFKGCAVGNMDMALTSEGMLGVTMGFLGLDKNPLTGTARDGSPTPVPSNPILAALNGSLIIDSTAVAVVTGLNFSLNNNLTSNAVIGSNISPAIFRGSANITGNFTAFFENATIPDAFDNETILKLHSVVEEPTAGLPGFMRFTFGAIKLGGATKTISADGGVLVDYPFQCILPAAATNTDPSALVIQRSNN